MQEIERLINLMPGYISVVDLNGNYLAFNNHLQRLMKTNNLIGTQAGKECESHLNIIKKLINSPVGTTVNWEFNFQGICLAISSIRNEQYIINQAVDITEQKRLEERNRILLKSLPEALNNSAGRRQNSDLENLVTILTEKPLIGQANHQENFIKLEVELRQNSSRLNNLERMLYLDETSLKDRISSLEIYQETDREKWRKLEAQQSLNDQLLSLFEILNHLPGGLKSWIVLLITLQIGITFVFEYVVISLNMSNSIEQIKEGK